MEYRYYIDIWRTSNMEEIKNTVSDAQKAAQKKYDQKTKLVSIKYTPADMEDYDRLMDYLDKTGQSKNSFIKMLINGFFEKGYHRYKFPIPKEYEKREYYKFECISDECFEKLKRILGDEEKYNIVLDYYDSCIKDELEYAFEEKGSEFEEWVDIFEDSVNSGEVNLNLSGKDFKKMIDESMAPIIREIFCG